MPGEPFEKEPENRQGEGNNAKDGGGAPIASSDATDISGTPDNNVLNIGGPPEWLHKEVNDLPKTSEQSNKKNDINMDGGAALAE